jgi:metal-responsive CopG/Arc/MetJ family transcriptional regulator
MKSSAVRTSIDLPRDLHRQIHEAAARKGCSARKLILEGIERAVEEARPRNPAGGSASIRP